MGREIISLQVCGSFTRSIYRMKKLRFCLGWASGEPESVIFLLGSLSLIIPPFPAVSYSRRSSQSIDHLDSSSYDPKAAAEV